MNSLTPNINFSQIMTPRGLGELVKTKEVLGDVCYEILIRNKPYIYLESELKLMNGIACHGSICEWRDEQYFNQRSNHQFLFHTVGSIRQISKIVLEHGKWWFTFSGGKIKATTTPCISVNEILGSTMKHHSYRGETRFGVQINNENKSYIRFRLTHRISHKDPYPHGWQYVNDLLLEK